MRYAIRAVASMLVQSETATAMSPATSPANMSVPGPLMISLETSSPLKIVVQKWKLHASLVLKAPDTDKDVNICGLGPLQVSEA